MIGSADPVKHSQVSKGRHRTYHPEIKRPQKGAGEHVVQRYYTGVFALLACLYVASVDAQIVHVWDLADATQPGQFTIFNPDANDAEFGTPITAGDIDGDGRDELVISAMAGDGPDNGRPNAGEVAIYFSDGTIAGQLDLSLGDARVVTVYGEAMHDIFGIKAHVGDVTGDGVQDQL